MSVLECNLVVRDSEEAAPEAAVAAIATRSTTLPVEVTRQFSQGLELMDQGEAAAAATCFEQIVESFPEYADAHVALGIADAVCGRVYPALDHLEEAGNLEPDNFFAHFKLGQLYFKLHVPQKGYESMRKALDCATSLQERKLVGQLIHRQKEREEKGLARPTWNRPFSRKNLLLVAASVALPLLYMFFASVH